MEQKYQNISPDKFVFVQRNAVLKDKKLDTKARSYLADAMIRFKKNKSSVVAAYILLFLVLYAIIIPFVSPYKVSDKDPDKRYVSFPPYMHEIAEKGAWRGNSA